MSASASASFLLVEDSEDDRFIFLRAFKRAGGGDGVQTVGDGRAAVDYLRGAPPYHDRVRHPWPAAVFLDLKLPRLNGLEVLEWMRGEPWFAHLTVIVLTSSAEARDIERAKELGARSYLVKPPSAETLGRVLAGLRRGAAPQLFP